MFTAVSGWSVSSSTSSNHTIVSRTRSARSSSRDATNLQRNARVDLRCLDEAVDLEVLALLDVHQPGRRAVVHRRDAVARQCRRVAEPARDVALGFVAEDLGVCPVDRADELVALVDLRARCRDVYLALDAPIRV